MRAKEFIKEAKSRGTPEKVSDKKAGPLPGVFVQKSLRNTDPYMQYRYSMAVAASRAHRDHGVDYDQESSWAENLTQVMFAPEDEETVMLASKLMGVRPTKITDSASREPNSTQTQSPVAKAKKNKYGI